MNSFGINYYANSGENWSNEQRLLLFSRDFGFDSIMQFSGDFIAIFLIEFLKKIDFFQKFWFLWKYW